MYFDGHISTTRCQDVISDRIEESMADFLAMSRKSQGRLIRRFKKTATRNGPNHGLGVLDGRKRERERDTLQSSDALAII
jgi:hypothetical protein